MKARWSLRGLRSKERALSAAAIACRFLPAVLGPAPVFKNPTSHIPRRLRGGPFVNSSRVDGV
jgi:hypothetical protein